VAVGFAIGMLLACAWYAVSQTFLFPAFAEIADSWLGRALMLRDGSTIDNVIDFEYDSYARELNARWKIE
jgi:hypothetical protein